MQLAMAIIGALGALAWLGMNVNGAWVTARVPVLSRRRAPTPEDWPSVAVVFAARDEASTIEPALRSVLATDYPDLEVVAVDDRSVDGTGEIIDRIAGEDARLTPLHVDALPDGWLGKTHALQQGFEATTADYVVFTDADVHLGPHILRDAMAIVLDERLEHLTMIPRFVAHGPLIGAWTAAFTDGYAARGRGSRRITHPTDGPAFGFGAFNLVRREVFATSEGFEWFRLDALDDVALGEVMRRAGARRGFLVADEGLEVQWYARFLDALRGVEKNGFGALAGYRLSRAIAFFLTLTVVLLLGPVLALVQTRWTLWPVVAAAGLALVAFQLLAALRFQRPLLHGLLTPLAIVAMGPALLRAGILATRRRGVVWRDTLYPLEELRAGRRVSFP